MHTKLYYIINVKNDGAVKPEDLIEEITAERLVDGDELYGLTSFTKFYTDWNTVLRHASVLLTDPALNGEN